MPQGNNILFLLVATNSLVLPSPKEFADRPAGEMVRSKTLLHQRCQEGARPDSWEGTFDVNGPQEKPAINLFQIAS